jgi:hypothetical protein
MCIPRDGVSAQANILWAPGSGRGPLNCGEVEIKARQGHLDAKKSGLESQTTPWQAGSTVQGTTGSLSGTIDPKEQIGVSFGIQWYEPVPPPAEVLNDGDG